MTTVLPPSYDDTVKGGANGAPPSYSELFPVKELKAEVNHAREDGVTPSVPLKICEMFCKSIACGICYLILALLPISMIVMGSVYFHDCDIEPKIPLFLIVSGCVALLQTTMHLFKMCLCRRKDEEQNSGAKEKGGNFCESMLTLFLFVWIIVGSYYTFNAFNPWISNDKMSCSSGGDTDYCCDAPVMLFSFVVLILIYSFFALSCCCFCCCVFCASFLASIGTNDS